jgi:integrase
MRGHLRKRRTWEYIAELGPQPAQRCESCGRRHWVEGKERKTCPGCGGELREAMERRQRCQAGFATRKLAQAALTIVLSSLESGVYAERKDVTLGEFLLEEWLPVTQNTIRSTTHASYSTHVKKHILPTLGRVRLQKLAPVMINALYAQLLKDGKVCGSGGLSANSVRRVHATLHRALNDAVRWDRLSRNPCDAADPPRQQRTEDEKAQAWTNLELRKFLEAVKSDRLYPLWLTLSMTGLRRGEALALRWIDVDLERARLSVRRSLVPINGTVEVHEPKTNRGRRLVALDPFTISVLRTWSRRQKEERLEWGPAWTDSGLVFTRADGKLIHPERVSKAFRARVKKTGLPQIHLHDLRHTHATLALEAGIHPKVVSDRLGHSTVAITLDIYSHAIPALSEQAAATVAALVMGE